MRREMGSLPRWFMGSSEHKNKAHNSELADLNFSDVESSLQGVPSAMNWQNSSSVTSFSSPLDRDDPGWLQQAR
jgi:hypothetical protein